MPPERPEGQMWVLFSKESPVYSAGLTGFRNTFNWTMSYRRDSDIWAPYGQKFEIDDPLLPPTPIQMPGDIPLDKWIQNKTKLVAWVSSNCKTRSKRELFKNALREVDPDIIDVFGGCGKHICSRREESCDHNKFWNDLARTYKFYFAAENSLCVDYITEKFWRTLEVGMVPVVYGGADYGAVAPPNSYIDVRDFKSHNELVEYLKKVGNDPEEYAKYFEWKRIYRVENTDCWKGWCELCRRTVQYEASPLSVPLVPKVHSDLHTWWFKGPVKIDNDKSGACVNGPLLLSAKT